MFTRTGVGVGDKGVGEIENEKQGAAGSTLLARGSLFAKENKTAMIIIIIVPSFCIVYICVHAYIYTYIFMSMQMRNDVYF